VSAGPELRTERLLLRRWRASDREPWAALNADPETMHMLPAPLTRDEADAMIDLMEAKFGEQGYGLWAVEVPGVADCIGFVGLNPTSFDAFFTPAVEVGWRLAKEHWGHGYATEGARAAVAFGFDEVGLDEIVSFTAIQHTASRAVMERIGMTHDPTETFVHPRLGPDHRLALHVLYRLPAPSSTATRSGIEI
jgi:RimJ/RimL family protein N-acetyltransferase